MEQTSLALKVLLKQHQEDEQNLGQKVPLNFKAQETPFIEKLKWSPLRNRDRAIVETYAKHLKNIASPLPHLFSLVKDGCTAKKIPDIVFTSESTVHFHRINLPRLLGIKNSTVNLRSYLTSISWQVI